MKLEEPAVLYQTKLEEPAVLYPTKLEEPAVLYPTKLEELMLFRNPTISTSVGGVGQMMKARSKTLLC